MLNADGITGINGFVGGSRLTSSLGTVPSSTTNILKRGGGSGNSAATTSGVNGVVGFESSSSSSSDEDNDDSGGFSAKSSGSTTMTRHLHFPSNEKNQHQQPLNIDFDHGRIEILLHHNAMGKNWIPICG